MDAKKDDPKTDDPKRDDPRTDDPKTTMLAELDLPGLFTRRADTVEKQKEAKTRLDSGKALHFTALWLGGAAMALFATWVTPAVPEYDPVGMVWLSTAIILWIAMWIAACFPTLTVRHLQDQANALARQVRDLDMKIEFCHQVLDEAKRVKIRKYAEVWVEKQAAAPKQTS
jgi:hypothetical protein